MKKTKLSLGLISCILSVGSLAGCDLIKSSKDGNLLKYSIDGVDQPAIKADDILADYYNDSTKYQSIFDTIYNVLVKNYFTKTRETNMKLDYEEKAIDLGEPQMAAIKLEAKGKVKEDKETAETNAEANKTKYKAELQTILDSKGVADLPELEEKYIFDLQKEKFEENFYKYYLEDIKTGATDVKMNEKDFWTGYLNDQVPYHVSHILVKLADSSDTNYYNGTISSDNALRLHTVLSQLADSKTTFAYVASVYNEDPGSKDKQGDLGIMDYDTSFINEFKLGIYAYETFYKHTDISKSAIALPEGVDGRYKDVVKDAFNIEGEQIPTVDMSIIETLKDSYDIETDEDGKQIIGGSSLVLPRNVIYNKYLNRHAVFFIKNGSTDNGNFKVVAGMSDKATTGLTEDQAILCANGDVTKPIIAVRASSGGEQEIHLMVVNRSYFDKNANNVPLDKYYTTYFPAQEAAYPKDADGKQLNTYVNFLTNDASETKTRAEEFASKLKSYSSDKLKKYIFLKYKQMENLKIKDETLDKNLNTWIETSVDKENESDKEAWVKTWNEYLDKLSRQNSERSKLVPQVCRIAFHGKYVENKAKTFQQVINEIETNLSSKEEELKKFQADKALMLKDLEDLDLGSINLNTLTISEAFKEPGEKGICNDGEQHL